MHCLAYNWVETLRIEIFRTFFETNAIFITLHEARYTFAFIRIYWNYNLSTIIVIFGHLH